MAKASSMGASIDALRAEVLAPISPGLASVAPGIGQLAMDFACGQAWSRVPRAEVGR